MLSIHWFSLDGPQVYINHQWFCDKYVICVHCMRFKNAIVTFGGALDWLLQIGLWGLICCHCKILFVLSYMDLPFKLYPRMALGWH